MSKHDSGPWQVETVSHEGKQHSRIRDIAGLTICQFTRLNEPMQLKSPFNADAANAALIAAAPEMYSLLKNIQAWFEGESFEYNEEIEKVLAKAEAH